MKKVLLFHNVPAPYRLPLFGKLSESYDLTVAFLQRRETGRLWHIKKEDLNFSHVFLKEISLSLFRKNVIVNRGISPLLDNTSPDAIIGLDNPPTILAMLKMKRECKKRSIPFLLWTGNFSGYKIGNNRFSKFADVAIDWIRRFILYPHTERFIAYGKNTITHLNNHYKIDENKIFAGTQGYPYEELIPQEFKYEEKARREAHGDNHIIYIGYLQSRKGIEVLFKAADLLREDHGKFNIWIIGEGEKKIKEIIDRYSKKMNIVFLGYKDGIEKYHYLKKAKILVLPSFCDPWGWVINEALYLGIPVVTTDNTMAKEMVIDGQNGYVVKSDNEKALKQAIKKLLLLKEEEYLRFCEKANLTASQYGLGYAVNCFKKAIESMNQ